MVLVSFSVIYTLAHSTHEMREAAGVDHIRVGLLQLELLSNDGDTFYAGCKLNRPVIIYSGGHGFCLRSVDFGSTSEHEGDTVDSIIKAQSQALDNGFLKYFCMEPLEHFHHCVCKNTSLNIACKLQYDCVVSLDAVCGYWSGSMTLCVPSRSWLVLGNF